MNLIDLILNLACVLLWLNWRSQSHNPLDRATPATLVGTLRPADSARFKGWPYLAAVILLLGFRAVIYWQIGSAAEWTPKINLVFVSLAFRSDDFLLCLVYSCLSFGRALLVLYFWLTALVVINRSSADAGPLQKAVRDQLGRVANWPWPLQLILPFVVTALIWMALHLLLLNLNIINKPQSLLHLVEQGLLVGACLLFSLKYLVPILLLLHLLVTYVYLGNSPIWEFISGTSRNLLRPLSWIPLRVGRIDLTPVLGMVIAVFLLHFLPEAGIREMLDRNVSIWPR